MNNMSGELIPINIVIGDRSYRIKTLPQDEESIRKTLKIINDKIVEFRTSFSGKDMQDYISMVLIWYATQVQNPGSEIAEKEVIDVLKKLEGKLDEVL
jgi:hypothetical protein